MKPNFVIVASIVLLMALPTSASAQQTSHAPSGMMQASDMPPQPTPFVSAEVGDTTRHLLQMQADGTQAGKPQPMLGVEATASYRRYMKSFEHPIPEYLKTAVDKSSNGSGNSGG